MEGAIPKELVGTYLRNGPGMQVSTHTRATQCRSAGCCGTLPQQHCQAAVMPPCRYGGPILIFTAACAQTGLKCRVSPSSASQLDLQPVPGRVCPSPTSPNPRAAPHKLPLPLHVQTAGRHTFDGDGQIVAFSFDGSGRVRFTNKFVHTRGFLDEQVRTFLWVLLWSEEHWGLLDSPQQRCGK